MSEAPTVDTPPAPAIAAKLPPAPRIPRYLQGLAFTVSRRWTVEKLSRRYGDVFTLDIPVFGHTVIVGDPQIAKQLFTISPEDAGNIQPNLSRVLGKGSVFALDGSEHRNRRRLLTPPFHGKSIKNYEAIIEEETLREIANWPEGVEFETLEPMMRITLNTILRAVFGADGAQLAELRRIIPPFVTLGSRVAVLPTPSRTYGRFSPWGRLAKRRSEYDAAVGRLIDSAKADPNLDERTDILALLLRSTYEDGSAMSREDVSDELLTLLAAGHETTGATLGWAFERITRHPEVLSALAAEADTDGNELRQATILEVQRSRTVIDFAGRHIWAPSIQLGDWVIPRDYSVIVAISKLHDNAEAFPNPERFDRNGSSESAPTPMRGRRSAAAPGAVSERRSPTWRWTSCCERCCGHFTIETTTAPDEKWHSRGVAYTPKRGGRAVVHRRR